MAQETADIRNKTRRVKAHILNQFLFLADKVEAGDKLVGEERQTYTSLRDTFAKNVVPRSHELGGDPDNDTPIPILHKAMNVPANSSDTENSPAPETD